MLNVVVVDAFTSATYQSRRISFNVILTHWRHQELPKTVNCPPDILQILYRGFAP